MKVELTLIFFMLFIPAEYNSAIGIGTQQPPEKGAVIRLFTDRSLYVAGEEIFFTAAMAVRDSGESVLYVELITPDGDKIRSGKFKSIMGIASGCLPIPDDLFTGSYYARAYTREMRNAGPASYEYVPVRIINPLKNDILIPEREFSGEVSYVTADTGNMQLTGLKPVYGRRDSVNFGIDIPKTPGKEIKSLCISIVPYNSLETSELKIKAENRQDSSIIYYPEPRGISLTGTLLFKDQKTPAANHVVSLSVLGAKDFSSALTDNKGRFFFTLPDDYGRKDIFLSPEDFSGSGMSLFIDNDFCTLPVSLPSPEFRLTEEEKKTVLSMAVNARIRKEFTGTSSAVDSVRSNSRPFYGEPTSTLVMDKYIQLPSLKEYFSEISQEVKVRDRKGKPYFKFFGSAAGMIINDPLVLVDWLVINDIERVLAISPQKILRIETVNKPYIKGDLTYGGIISIISRDGDFAGIDLPVSGIFVKYDFFAPVCSPENAVKQEHTPDARNTLFWLPQLDIKENSSTGIDFMTGDTPGKYMIEIRGMTSDGHVFIQSAVFEVRY